MKAITVLVCFLAGPAQASTFEDCILSKMPGVMNDAAAQAIVRLCRQENPDNATKKRNGWFDYSSGAECTAKKARDTPSRVGGNAISIACYRLYEPAPKPSSSLF